MRGSVQARSRAISSSVRGSSRPTRPSPPGAPVDRGSTSAAVASPAVATSRWVTQDQVESMPVSRSRPSPTSAAPSAEAQRATSWRRASMSAEATSLAAKLEDRLVGEGVLGAAAVIRIGTPAAVADRRGAGGVLGGPAAGRAGSAMPIASGPRPRAVQAGAGVRWAASIPQGVVADEGQVDALRPSMSRSSPPRTAGCRRSRATPIVGCEMDQASGQGGLRVDKGARKHLWKCASLSPLCGVEAPGGCRRAGTPRLTSSSGVLNDELALAENQSSTNHSVVVGARARARARAAGFVAVI